jgi:hypothetical protein
VYILYHVFIIIIIIIIIIMPLTKFFGCFKMYCTELGMYIRDVLKDQCKQ